MKKLNKLLSIIICLAMVLSFVPATYAAETTETKITSMDQLETGTYKIVCGDANLGVVDGTWITNAESTWTITVNGTNAQLTDANGVAVGPKAGNNNGISTGTAYDWAVTCENGLFSFWGQGDDTTVLARNASDGRFRAYKTATVSGYPDSYPNGFELYKIEESSGDGEENGPAGTAADPFIIESLPTTLTGMLTEDNVDIGHFYRYEVTENGTFEMLGFSKCNLMMYLNGSLQTSDYFDVVPGDVVVVNVFAFSYNGSEYSVNLDFTPGEAPVVEVPRLEDGTYVIFWGELTFQALAETYTYGYAPAGDVNNPTELDIVTITNTEDGKFTMTDAYGRTIYMTGTYNSFNVTTDEVTEGHEWILEDVGNGCYYVKNVLKEKYIAYSESYTTWGCYSSISETSELMVVAFSLETEEPEEPVVPEEPEQEGPLEGNILVLGNNKLAAHESTSEYTFTATQTGTLYITIRNYAMNGIEYGDRMLGYKWSEIYVDDVALTAMQTTLEVTEGQVLSIDMTTDGDPYESNLYLSFNGFYQEPEGGAFNPIDVFPNDSPFTTEIGAGEEVYYHLSYENYDANSFTDDYILYVYGENAYIVYEDWIGNERGDVYIYAENGVVTYAVWKGYDIRIGNAGDTAATFEVVAEIPLGTQGNPAELVLGDNVTAMTAEVTRYFYTWTAEAPGVLTLTISGDSFWNISAENLVSGEYYYKSEKAGDDNVITFAVSQGDVITIYLALYDDGWESIDGTLTLNAAFVEGAGEDLSLHLENNFVKVRNNYGPATTKDYTYVAEQTGTLYITFRSFGCYGYYWEESRLSDEYYAQCVNIFVNGEQTTVFRNSVEVTEGDSVVVSIASLDGSPYEANIWLSYEGFYEEPVGSELNPVVVPMEDLPTNTVEIPAGEALHYKFTGEYYDYTLHIYGEDAYIITEVYNSETDAMEEVYIYAVNGVVEYALKNSAEILIGNAGEAANTFYMEATIPLGIYNNPDTLIIGEQVAPVPGDYNGYWYTWTAPEAGTLTITVIGENWGFELSNPNASQYIYCYEYEGNENTASVPVAEGDVVRVNVLSVGPGGWGDHPGGDMTVIAEFVSDNPVGGEEAALGDVNGDTWVDVEDAMMILQYEVGLLGDEDLNVTVGDVSGDGWVDVEDAMLILQFEVGLIEKFPAEEEGGETTAELPLGNYLEIEAGTYTFTAEEDTLLVLSMNVMDNPEWAYTINGVTRAYYDDLAVSATVLKVAAGETVTVVFDSLTYAHVASCAGTAEDPIMAAFVWNEEYSSAYLNIDMPAGDYVFTMNSGVGMNLSVGGVATEMTGDGWFDPITFSASVAEAGVVPMTLSYPVGSYYNPELLIPGYNTADVVDTDQGYWYTYTAENDCLFVLSMFGENWFYSAMIIRADGSFGYPDGHWTSENPMVPMQVLDLKAGDKVLLNFGTDDYSADTVEFTASVCTGTAESPIEVQFVMNEAYTEGVLNIDMPAGDYVFQMMTGAGMILTVDGVVTEMTGDGWFDPITFSASVAEAGIVEMTLSYPAGTYYNPQALELGYNSAEIDDSGMGYWYTYTAESDTLFYLSVYSENWFYSAMIQRADGSFGYPDGHWSSETDAEGNLFLVPMQVLELKTGDVLLLNFGTDDYAAGYVDFEAYTCAGTAEDPILTNFTWNMEGTAASLNIDLPAGEFVLGQQRISGMELTVDGVETEVTDGGWFAPCTFVVNNETAGVVSMELTYATGTMFNPQVVEAGEYTAEIEEGNWDGYFYSFVATADGTLTITVTGEPGWYFVINNLTSGVYGDGQFSDANENTMTIEVSAGDVIEIVVNAYDPNNGMGVGGTVTTALSFTPAE